MPFINLIEKLFYGTATLIFGTLIYVISGLLLGRFSGFIIQTIFFILLQLINQKDKAEALFENKLIIYYVA